MKYGRGRSSEWYEHGWGLALAIFFLPYFVVWYGWRRSNWSKATKVTATVLVAVMVLAVFVFVGLSYGTDSILRSESRVAQTLDGVPDQDARGSESDRIAGGVKGRERKEALAQQVDPTGDTYQVVSITDGDTIKVDINGAVETIRFIGMDTPETKDPRKPVQCFGREATSKMQSYVQSKRVRLEVDSSQGDRDKYGRLLRYVFTEAGLNVAYEMIRQGYAHEYTYRTPYKYQVQFKKAEKSAKSSGAGLWAASTCGGVTDQQYTSTPKAAPRSSSTLNSTAPSSVSSVYYKNCAAARAAGAAPVYRGQPGYGAHLDRDADGIGCE